MIESQVRELQALLERKIDERGATKAEIEQGLGWEEGAIGRLLAGEEPLTVEQVFAILGVIRVDSDVFFTELSGPITGTLPLKLAELKTLIGGVVNLLVRNDVITADALANAVAAQAIGTARPPHGRGASRDRSQSPPSLEP